MKQSYTIEYVTSKDGTTIGYRQLGQGPGLVIMHGGMQASQNFMQLAEALSDEFTIYLPDRRGRGLSGPTGANYSMKKECEDMDALLRKTGAHHVFGLSSGALISLYAALKLPAIHKVALYEPPLNITPIMTFMPRYDREIAKGQLAAALVTVMKGLQLSPFLKAVPRFLLLPVFKLAMRSDRKEVKDKACVSLTELIPTFHFDNLLIKETEGLEKKCKQVHAKALLMGGSKSPGYFRPILTQLKAALPNAAYIEFPGLNHSGPDDGGKPQVVARELRQFFKGIGN